MEDIGMFVLEMEGKVYKKTGSEKQEFHYIEYKFINYGLCEM